jgi:hypothetical protein
MSDSVPSFWTTGQWLYLGGGVVVLLLSCFVCWWLTPQGDKNG